jgi:hypothetical protein
MIQEYYRQMRKFGCNILAVVQQYDIIKDSPVRGAMIGNSDVSHRWIHKIGLTETVGTRSIQRMFVHRPWEFYAGYGSAGEQSTWLRLAVITCYR